MDNKKLVSPLIDKDVVYNVLVREIHNILQDIPMAGLFENAIINYVFNFAEPYINAFSAPGDRRKVDVDQLSNYASYEIKNKIEEFKKSQQQSEGGVAHEN